MELLDTCHAFHSPERFTEQSRLIKNELWKLSGVVWFRLCKYELFLGENAQLFAVGMFCNYQIDWENGVGNSII